MSEHIMVDFAQAEAWKQRADASAKAERLARAAVKAASRAVKTGGINVSQEALAASEAATQAAKEAEQVWLDTAAILK